MIELETNMWKEPADAYVITTNGDVNRGGNAVMGRGCTREAALMFTDEPSVQIGVDVPLAHYLGNILKIKDNNWVYDLGSWVASNKVYQLISFPVKHHWYERADLDLIQQSALDLVMLVNRIGKQWSRVLVPRPGCGNGQLQWKNVKPIIEPILDDRFVVVHRKFL